MADTQKHELLQPSEAGELARYYPNVKILLMDSGKIDYPSICNVSLVFIDGNHSYDAIKTDTEKALEYFGTHKSTRPGCIAWHDYTTWCCQGVRDDLDLRSLEGRSLVYLDLP